MNDRHPNHPDNNGNTTIDDAEVMDGEIIEPLGTGVLATIHRVEIDQQVATAKSYPRNVIKIKQELTALVTMDEETADDCIYALPRGNKHIKGPSARFADALISFWGNARSGAFITQVDREDKFVEAIGSFQDVERNVIRQRRVRRPISGRDGRLYNADMINMTGNAACVIAERNAILNGIPKSLWSGAYEQAFALVAGTVKTLEEKLARAEKHFMAMGISMDQVLEKLGYSDIGKIIPDDIVTMRGMLTALRSGEETVETIFGRGAGRASHEVVENPLKDDPISTGLRGNSQSTAGAEKVTGTDGTVIKDRNGPKGAEPASTNEAKSDVGAAAAGKAAEQGSGKPDQTSGTAANNAQAAPAEPAGAGKPAEAAKPAADKPYTDAGGYISHMQDAIDKATGRSAITDVWGSTRSDRNELLTSEQIDELTKYKEAKLKKLKGGG